MPRVARSPRNSVKDRPARLKLLLRRQKRLLRPAAWGVFGLTVIMIGVIAVHSAAPSGTLATLRERLGGATGFTGLRVTDVVIEGRANTPEPLLRAALSVNRGDPILGFWGGMARRRMASWSWVVQAPVARQRPGGVVVNLKERRPFAVWQNQGKFALIDRNGQLVADQNVSEFRTLPTSPASMTCSLRSIRGGPTPGCSKPQSPVRIPSFSGLPRVPWVAGKFRSTHRSCGRCCLPRQFPCAAK